MMDTGAGASAGYAFFQRRGLMNGSAASVTPERIMQYAWSFVPPLVLEAAVRHGVFDVLDQGSKTAAELSAATGASERGIRMISNALVGMELLSKDSEGRYSLTPESARFLVSTKPGFHGGFLRHVSTQLLPRWLDLAETVRKGSAGDGGRDNNPEREEFFRDFVADLFPVSYPTAQALARALCLA